MTRSRLVFGLSFIAFGGVLLLDQAGALDAGATLAAWWPLVVVLMGVAQMSTHPRNPVGGVIVAGVGVVLLAWTLGVVDTIGVLWPVVLIALGAWLLVRRPGRREGPVAAAGDVTVVFGDRRARAPAGPLTTESITAVLGDVDLDLRDSRIDGKATVRVVCVLADVDLEVPPEWNVTVSGPEVLGSVKVTTARALPADAPTLHLELVTVLGDVSVTTAPSVQERA